jgi:RNA polymerase sigma-70 factor, ECF subfamily
MHALAITGDWPDPVGSAYAVGPAKATGGELSMPTDTGARSFDEFYGAAAVRVVRHSYALTGNLADAQDIAQEAFARAWQRWASVSACESPEAWVRHVATNLATTRWRRDRTARAARSQLAAQQSVPEISPNTVALVAALRSLPERHRVVLVLHYLADLPVDQIAADLGCPVGSVKGWLSRGRAALAAIMSASVASPGSSEVTGG